MGKQSGDGREAFRNALSSSGYTDMFDEEVDDYDVVGDAVYSIADDGTGEG